MNISFQLGISLKLVDLLLQSQFIVQFVGLATWTFGLRPFMNIEVMNAVCLIDPKDRAEQLKTTFNY